LGLEKSLIDILHEHNNDYYRAQNGCSGDTWNQMMQLFQERNPQVNFVKSQLQDKEKELKREYKMLKEARMQSGAGWDEKTCMIVVEKALWDNLEIVSFCFSILILGHKLHNKLRLIVSSHHSFAVLSKNWEIQEKWLSYV
jgi:hypothetical protein